MPDADTRGSPPADRLEGDEPVPAERGPSKKLRIAAAVASRPAEFRHEAITKYTRASPADRDLLELFDVNYRFNPAELLTPSDHEMAALWRLRRSSGGMAGAPLPDRGGLLDQSAIMMEAFAIMDGALQEIEAEERERSIPAKGGKS